MSKFSTYISLFIFLFFIGSDCISQEATSILFKNFNTTDRLPSLEVYGVEQDDEGYMWFITDNGISRFDGYSFKNYSLDDGFDNNVFFQIKKGRNGELWFISSTGSIYILKEGSFSDYKYNNIIKSFTVPTVGLSLRLDTLSNSIFLNYLKLGILEIQENGEFQMHCYPKSSGIYLKKIRDFILSTIIDCKENDAPLPRKEYQDVIYEDGDKDKVKIDPARVSRTYMTRNFQIGKDSTLLSTQNKIYLYVKGNFVKQLSFSHPVNKIIKSPLNTYWVCLGGSGGILKVESLEDLFLEKGTTILSGNACSSIYFDKEGGVWISTLNNGIFYAPFDKVLKHNLLDNKGIKSLCKKDNALLLLGTDKSILEFHPNTNIKTEITGIPITSPIDIAYNHTLKKLYVSKNTYVRDEKHIVTNTNYSLTKVKFIKNDSLIFAKYSNGFFIIDAVNYTKLFSSAPAIKKRFFDIQKIAYNSYLIGGIDGVYSFKNNKLSKLENIPILSNRRIEAIAQLPDSTLIFGTNGHGMIFYKDSIINKITAKEGLYSNKVTQITVENQNSIWALTALGLCHLIKENNDWICIRILEGYREVNKYNDFELLDSSIYLATDIGLLSIPNTHKNFKPKSVIFRNAKVNQNSIDISKLTQLKHNQNDIEIDYFSPMLPLNGNIIYRYKFAKNSDWNSTQKTNLTFLDMQSGDYVIEIQASNNAGEWSNSNYLKICIERPFWEEWWFYVICGVFLLGLGYFIVRKRIDNLARSKNIQIQLLELEKAAIQAQIDPHFLYNCLNSIQCLIVSDDKKAAMIYLSDFSELMRFKLKSSLKEKVLLEEEINFIEQYLKLELLRFDDSFSYKIEIDENLDSYTEIPPMVIQPFIENSIIHGFKNLKYKGKIILRVFEQGQYMCVEVEDNGVGFGASTKDSIHDSEGMNLVRKRLVLYNGTDKNPLEIHNLNSSIHNSSGTLIRVFILNEID